MVFLLLIILALLLLKIQDQFNRVPVEPQIAARCSACGEAVELDWVVCPHCRQRLTEHCGGCQSRKLVSQVFCPFCGNRGGCP